LLIVLLCIIYVQTKVYMPSEKSLTKSQAFDEYNAFWNKTHKSHAERAARYLNFVDNAKKIYLGNRFSKGATYGFTKFSDMSAKEFKTKMTGHKSKNPPLPKHLRPVSNKRNEEQPGTNIDWFAKGKCTPIKNQGSCGSCWAFSATEAIESAILMAGKPSVELGAPQMIVDCDSNENGCGGGDGREAMNWLIAQGGQDLESCYPYTGQNGNCQSSQCTPTNKISSVTPIDQDEASIYKALTTSPLAICCDASAWQNYNGGVLQGSDCGDNVDHEIQLTGYSTSQGGYWVVRNSWGADWGENGFIFLQYGANTCDITSEVSLATY